jgi:CMP-N-acetylneuraminic acid synthetase
MIKILGLIPARGGSKRLPRKNALPLAGKPLIAWTIEAARAAGVLYDVVVSSDDDEIIHIAHEWGAQVPFIRPKELASDTATTLDVVQHALQKLMMPYDAVMILQPTSPLRRIEDIKAAVALMYQQQARGVVSVTQVRHPVEWAHALPEDGKMDDFLQQIVTDKRSQDLPVRYRVNGAICLVATDEVVKHQRLFPPTDCYAYRMDSKSSIDIDDAEDFQLAEAMLRMGCI